MLAIAARAWSPSHSAQDDLSMMRESRTTFPGRRGQSDVVDFNIHTLTFREYMELGNAFKTKGNITEIISHPDQKQIEIMYQHFSQYLKYSFFLTDFELRG